MGHWSPLETDHSQFYRLLEKPALEHSIGLAAVGAVENGAGDKVRTRDVQLGKLGSVLFSVV